jgi:dihydroorotate dehydrogenase
MAGYVTLRRLLFGLEPETAHDLALRFLRLLQSLPPLQKTWRRRNLVRDTRLSQEVWGLSFPNPVGLAAGFDKDARVVRTAPALGFGFTEVGTVTPEPQAGNPRPRIRRFPAQESLQNWLGFNNRGMAAMAARLARVYPAPIPVGVNIGKSRATPRDRAPEDYRRLLVGLRKLCDYFAVNVSSPNTPGLRELQSEAFLRPLLAEAKEATSKPVLVKIAPDLEISQAVDLCSAAVEAGASGIIATNTTIDYSLLPAAGEARGGLSGGVLREKSFRLFEGLARELFGKTVLVSVGGIDSAAEVYRRIRCGASLVQLYTALVFHGPGLVGRINRQLLRLLEQDGLRSLSEAVGADRRPAGSREPRPVGELAPQESTP